MPRIYRHTGSGLNACNQSAQLLWLKRHAPELLGRAATAFHCKDWLYFKLTGERAPIPPRASSPSATSAPGPTSPSVLDALGLADARAPAAADRRRQPGSTHPLTAAAAAATGLPEGLPVVLGYLDVLCTGLGGGLYDPARASAARSSARPACICGSCPTPTTAAQRRSRSATPCRSRCRAASRRCSPTWRRRSTSTGWSTWRARRPSCWRRRVRPPRPLLATLDDRVLGAPAGSGALPSLHLEAGERGPFVDANARAQFIGLSTRHQLCRPGARRL